MYYYESNLSKINAHDAVIKKEMQKAQERREDRGEKKDRALHIDVHPQNPISAYEANNRGTIRT